MMFLAASPGGSDRENDEEEVGDTTVHYKVVLPNGYDPAKAYPAILAMGGGPQTMNTVDGILESQLPCRGRKARLYRCRSRGAGR